MTCPKCGEYLIVSICPSCDVEPTGPKTIKTADAILLAIKLGKFPKADPTTLLGLPVYEMPENPEPPKLFIDGKAVGAVIGWGMISEDFPYAPETLAIMRRGAPTGSIRARLTEQFGEHPPRIFHEGPWEIGPPSRNGRG